MLRFVLYFVMYTLTSICFTISRPNRTFYVGQAYTNFVTQLNSFLTLFFICFVSIIDSTESLDWNQKVIDPRKAILFLIRKTRCFVSQPKKANRPVQQETAFKLCKLIRVFWRWRDISFTAEEFKLQMMAYQKSHKFKLCFQLLNEL